MPAHVSRPASTLRFEMPPAMKCPTFIFLVVVVSAGRLAAAADEMGDAIARIKQIAKQDAQSYEHALEHAWPIVNDAFQRKDWPHVDSFLKTVGLTPTVVDEHGGSTEYRCILQRSAFVIGDFKFRAE
jgi:hypothetical protein